MTSTIGRFCPLFDVNNEAYASPCLNGLDGRTNAKLPMKCAVFTPFRFTFLSNILSQSHNHHANCKPQSPQAPFTKGPSWLHAGQASPERSPWSGISTPCLSNSLFHSEVARCSYFSRSDSWTRSVSFVPQPPLLHASIIAMIPSSSQSFFHFRISDTLA